MKASSDIPNIDLNQRDWDELKRIISEYVPEYTIWAFGSRVTGSAKPYSDLDIVIHSEQPLPLGRMAAIKDAIALAGLQPIG